MGNQKIYDVVVIGGGPSGLNTARLLADNGLDVIILEAKDSIGKDVICTGIVGINVFERFDLSKKSLLYETKTIELLSPSGNKITYKHPFAFASVVDRKIFDSHLLELAINNGARISLNSMVFDIIYGKDCVSIKYTKSKIDTEIVKGKVVVIATGINNNLNKIVGLGYPKYFLKAAQGYIKNTGENIKILFGNNMAKNGFGWIVPIENHIARVGLITDGDPKKGFESLRNTFNFESLDLIQDSIRYKPIAQGIVSKTYGERVIVVGEAAGQVKTTTGGGLYFGLLCSELAASTIKNAFEEDDFSENKLSLYEKRWKSLISEEIRKGMFVRKLCGRLNDNKIENIFKTIKSDGFFDYIAKNADFDWHGMFVLNLYRKIANFLS